MKKHRLLRTGAIIAAGASLAIETQAQGPAIVRQIETRTVFETNEVRTFTKNAAGNVTKEEVREEVKPKEELKQVSLSPVNNIVHLQSSVILLNPYKVVDGTNANGRVKNLEAGDSQAQFYIDVAANYVWAWNPERRWRWAQDAEHGPGADRNYKFGIGSPDFQGHLTFVADGDDKVSASAIVGSGEFGLEATIGVPFFRAMYMSDAAKNDLRGHASTNLFSRMSSAHWIGAVASYSGTTDSDAFDIHSRYLAGIGYRAAFKAPWDAGDTGVNREVVCSFTGGIAGIETLEFVNGSDREVKLERDGVLSWNMETAFGLEAEVYLPINKTANLVLGTRLYAGPDPNPWNAYVAFTIPFSTIAKVFE